MTQQNEPDVEVSFSVDGLRDELFVLRFHGEESLSQLFRFEVELACSATTLDFKKVVGKNGLLTLQSGAHTRYVHGMVCRFQVREKGRRYTVYHATVVPKAWRLLQRRDCRIFQKKNIKQIITGILQQAGIDNSFRTKGNQDPPRREYCVQYQESDWSFISRLLEEEGFTYYFEHARDKHTLHIANSSQFHPDLPGRSSTVNYHGPDPLTAAEEHIFSLYVTEMVQSGKVTLNEFNFTKPSLSLSSDKSGDLDTDLEIYDFPGLFEVPEVGRSLAEVRLQEAQAKRMVADGQSDCFRFAPGYLFALDLHYRTELNKKKYLLTQVLHHGDKHQDLEAGAVSNRMRYSNTFRCIPKDTTYRPPRITPKPRVMGCQTAIVVGPSGEEIYTDEHGRVKVHFHWDRLGQRNESSSCWIRVSQIWAGQGWGAMFIPRIGQEVVVDFLEGDPDRPLIVGRVYHASNVVPYTLPDEKTKSTVKSNSSIGGGGSNEIRFEDKKGSEELYLHAQKNMNIVVKRNQSTKVGGSQSVSVGGEQSITVGGNRTVTVRKGDEKVTVAEGQQEVTVKGDSTLTVQQGSRYVIVETGNYDVWATTHAVIGAAEDTVISGNKIDISGFEEVKLSLGASSIVMDASGISINGPLVKINCG